MFDLWPPKFESKDPAEQRFIESLHKHMAFVDEAGRMLGVPVKQLEIHDNSKWSDEEFYAYVKHFEGGGAPDEFARAWLHHLHLNPHHWQHHIFPDGFTPKNSDVEQGVVQMPANYVLEMVADWMGASMAYTGSFDMTKWLIKKIPRIRVHSKTAMVLREILDSLGYADLEMFNTLDGKL